MEQKRLQSFDIAKGIGIILMIIGHCSIKNQYINNFIYSFHMPLFFLISGYFFKYKEDKECLKRNFKKLIIPYIITCLAIIACEIAKLVLKGDFTEIWDTTKTWLLASFYGSGSLEPFGIRFIGAIWFLWALFFSLYFINVTSKMKYQYLWVILIAYIGYKTSQYIWLPLSIQAGMVATVFVYLGTVAKKYNIFNINIHRLLILVSIAIVIFCTIYCGKVYMVSNSYKNGFLDIIGALCGSFLCIKSAKFIDNHVKFIKKPLVFIGENTLLILCLHLVQLNCIYFGPIQNIMKNIGIEIASIRNLIISFLWVAISLPILKLINLSVKKIKEELNKEKYGKKLEYKKI